MTRDNVYELAETEGACIYDFPLESREALSIYDPDGCAIAIDPEKVKSFADWQVKAMHEIGHCATGAFYTISSPLETRQRRELRADRWAIKKLVPRNQLMDAISRFGLTQPWELAEYFEVTEEFILKAIYYYECCTVHEI